MYEHITKELYEESLKNDMSVVIFVDPDWFPYGWEEEKQRMKEVLKDEYWTSTVVEEPESEWGSLIASIYPASLNDFYLFPLYDKDEEELYYPGSQK